MAAAAGLVFALCTDAALVSAGAGHFSGVPLGLLAAPLVLIAACTAVRRELRRDPAAMWLVLGTAWIIAPFVDQHLTHAVALDGVVPDFVHHAAGWSALALSSRRWTSAQRRTVGRPGTML